RARVAVRQRLRARPGGSGLVLDRDRRRPRPRGGYRGGPRAHAGGGRRRRDPAAAHARARRRRGCDRDGGRVRLMAELRYREALGAALHEELRRDERVILLGEDIGVFGGAFKVTEGLLEEFGERRVRDTPISENTIVGVGVGAAMTGLRPVVELMTINFALLAFDQIV